MSGPAIGIDLGTTYSGVAVYCDNWLRMITDEHNNVIIPSLVAYDNNQILVGNEVRYQMMNNSENSIFEVKRFIGRQFSDPSIESGINLNRWPFEIFEDNKRIKIKVNFNGEVKNFLPEEISSHVLKKLKVTAEKNLGQPIENVVISVPAYFNHNQREATQTAATLAGLNPLKIINEPTAAALAFGFGRDETEKEKTILVYDLGGGTFDVSILNICKRNFLVRSSTGDSSLGGEDFTNRLRNYIITEFEKIHKIDIGSNKLAIARLKNACEKAKKRLSLRDSKEVTVFLDKFCLNSSNKQIDLNMNISRAQFEHLNKDLFDQTLTLVRTCLAEAKLIPSQIDEVVLVGGSTRIPKIQELLEKEFTSQRVNRTVNPDEAVALGAAVEAAVLSGVNCPQIKDTVLLDVTPLSLGVDIIGDEMSVVIKKNSLIPCRVTRNYQTAYDYQKSICHKVYQGERARATDNFFLGEFILRDIEIAPKGEVKTDITFDLNSDGLLTATIVEKKTGNSKSISIEKSISRLSDKEIKNMIETAKQLDAVDRAFRRKAAKKRQLDQYTYDVQNYLSLNTTKKNLSAADYRQCKDKNDAALEFLSINKTEDEVEYQDWLDELQDICEPVIGPMFQADKNRRIGESLSIVPNAPGAYENMPSKYDVD